MRTLRDSQERLAKSHGRGRAGWLLIACVRHDSFAPQAAGKETGTPVQPAPKYLIFPRCRLVTHILILASAPSHVGWKRGLELGAKVHLFGPGIFMQTVCGFGETLVLGLDCSIYEGRDIKSRSRFGASQSRDGATLIFEVRWAFLVSQILLGARQLMLPPILVEIFRAALDAVACMS